MVNENGRNIEREVDIAITEGKVASLRPWGGTSWEAQIEEIDCKGLHILPGVIDSQVHFREPGHTHKEDLASGTRSALAGGVTLIFDMPNTQPSTTNKTAMEEKIKLSHERSFCHVGFYFGATAKNIPDFSDEILPSCCPGIKVFLGSSTGDLLMDDLDYLSILMRKTKKTIALHSEHEGMLKETRLQLMKRKNQWSPADHPTFRNVQSAFESTKSVIALAEKQKRSLHILHISTQEEIEWIAKYHKYITCEVTPQHLYLEAPECYEQHGSFAQMNPPIRERRHREALWKALKSGVINVIGSDHAPHTREEKSKPYPESPSGIPGVQTLVPLLLNAVSSGQISLERMVNCTSTHPSELFRIKGKGRIMEGNDADFTIVDLKSKQIIEKSWLLSRCGWSPFIGQTVTGWPVYTVLMGTPALRDGEVNPKAYGKPAVFV